MTVGVWLTFVAIRLANAVHASERRLILFWFVALVVLPLGRAVIRVFIRSRVAFLQRTHPAVEGLRPARLPSSASNTYPEAPSPTRWRLFRGRCYLHWAAVDRSLDGNESARTFTARYARWRGAPGR